MDSVDIRPTGRDEGLQTCRVCGELAHVPGARAVTHRCHLCGSRLEGDRADSLARTAAFLLAAAILYVPANVLPVMHTGGLLRSEDDTIFTGVMLLLNTGSWPLAVLVFTASIFVPMLKLLALSTLVITTWRQSHWAPLQRTRLYRLIEAVGRWSMLDIYVITVLVALVQFQGLATISPGPGALAFAAVVVLTMLSARSFDPRLIWRASQDQHG